MRSLLSVPLAALLLGAVTVFAELDPAAAVGGSEGAASESVRHASVPAPKVREPSHDTAAVRAAIARAYAEWSEAYAAGDSRRLAAYYTSEASLVSATEQTIEGRANIVEFLADQRRAGLSRPSLRTLEVITVGNIAYEIGTYGLRFEAEPLPQDDAGGDRVPASDGARAVRVESGRYFAVWRAQADGSWLYHLGVWTATPGADTAPATAMAR